MKQILPVKAQTLQNSLLTYLTLFSSMGTLICCALPALLVSLGLGAIMAGLVANVPGLIWLSEHKTEVFVFAGSLLMINGVLRFLNRNAPCPIDPILRQACIKSRKFASLVYWASILIFLVGVFFAFIAPQIL